MRIDEGDRSDYTPLFNLIWVFLGGFKGFHKYGITHAKGIITISEFYSA